MQNWEAGEILGGKYRLVRQLGQGGMGSVWRAEHLTLSSPVALKLIDPSTAKDPEIVQRFLREARTAAALRSPHVVQILDYGVDGDTPYIAMELLDGESLAERLSRVGRLSLRETSRVIQHVARAIGRAHDAGIVHRDLKPENVFIVKNDDDEIIKVLDFGIVKANPAMLVGGGAAATRTGTLLGTPYYMSPEQTAGEKTVDHRADIWALGVIAFKCLVGHLPFNGDSIGKLVLEICTEPLPIPSRLGTVPRGFDAWFASACARERAARFQSAKQAAAAFAQLEEGSVLTPEPASRPGPPRAERALVSTTSHSANSEIASRPRRAATPRRVLWGLGTAALAAFALFEATRGAGPDLARDTAALNAALSNPDQAAKPASSQPPRGASPRETSASRDGSERQTDNRAPPSSAEAAGADLPARLSEHNGRVEVRSAPEGAAVFVNGEPTGLRTPVVLKGLPQGRPLELRVAKTGFISQKREIQIAGDSVEAHTFELLASDGLVRFSGAPRDARFYVDGAEVVVRHGEPVPLTVGPHVVRVETPEALIFSGTVNVVAGDQTIRVGARTP